jgi:endonuclease/exonuclease/phosphatase family metal-dependent hydrolase
MSPKKQKGDLRILFWNIKDWFLRDGESKAAARLDRVLSVLRREKPDIALFAEVNDPAIKTALLTNLKSGHVAFETNDKNPPHLVAVFRAAAGRSVSVEQRNEILDGNPTGRSLPMLNIIDENGPLAILAAHTKSGIAPENLTKRQKQFQQIAKIATEFGAERIPLLVVGDMNTMGDGEKTSGAREIEIASEIMGQGGLIRLPKDRKATWHGVDADARFTDADLDHAFISRSAAFRAATVRVGGWPELPTTKRQDNWVRTHSDHAYIVVDIKPVPRAF